MRFFFLTCILVGKKISLVFRNGQITNGSAEDKVTVHFRPCGDKESEAYLTLQLNPDNGELEGASVCVIFVFTYRNHPPTLVCSVLGL